MILQVGRLGFYSKALAGQIKNFFDVDIPYEAPVNYEIKIDATRLKPLEIVKKIGDHFDRVGILSSSLGSSKPIPPESAVGHGVSL